jgi:molybdopterin converting factor subunit 1
MRLRVLFFGQLKDIVGTAEEEVQVEGDVTLGVLFERYCRQHPALEGLRHAVVLARNREFGSVTLPLADGDEIAFLPPVSGG